MTDGTVDVTRRLRELAEHAEHSGSADMTAEVADLILALVPASRAGTPPAEQSSGITQCSEKFHISTPGQHFCQCGKYERAGGSVPAVPPQEQAIAALKQILAHPYGCRFCDSGVLRKPGNPHKQHDDDCGWLLAQAAIEALAWVPSPQPELKPCDANRFMHCDLPNGHVGPHAAASPYAPKESSK